MKIDGRTLDHKTLEHLRISACKRVLEDGELPSAVAASVGFCRTSIYPWLRRAKDEGLEALVEKIAEGPDPKLNEEQRQSVKRWIVGKDPRQYGFDFGLWTRRIVQTMIQKKFQVELCLTSVGKLLAQLDLTPQKPLRRAYERDPVRIELWTKEEFPKLKKRARKHGAKIYFLDETGFSSEPNLRRTYGLKGDKAVVKTSGQRQKVNVISAVSMQGAFWCQIYTHTLKHLNPARVLGKLAKLGRKSHFELAFFAAVGRFSIFTLTHRAVFADALGLGSFPSRPCSRVFLPIAKWVGCGDG